MLSIRQEGKDIEQNCWYPEAADLFLELGCTLQFASMEPERHCGY